MADLAPSIPLSAGGEGEAEGEGVVNPTTLHPHPLSAG